MAYTLLKDRIEYPLARLYATNWLAVCRDKQLNIASLMRSIGKPRNYVYCFTSGVYSCNVNLYTLQLLADLVEMSVLDIFSYTPILPPKGNSPIYRNKAIVTPE